MKYLNKIEQFDYFYISPSFKIVLGPPPKWPPNEALKIENELFRLLSPDYYCWLCKKAKKGIQLYEENKMPKKAFENLTMKFDLVRQATLISFGKEIEEIQREKAKKEFDTNLDLPVVYIRGLAARETWLKRAKETGRSF